MFLKNLEVELLYNLATLLLGTYQEDIKSLSQTEKKKKKNTGEMLVEIPNMRDKESRVSSSFSSSYLDQKITDERKAK